jgi:hypothetical protein
MKAIHAESPITSAAVSINGPAHPHGRQSTNGDQRQQLLSRASDLHSHAKDAAERGEVAAAARSILEALDFERRAGGLGPQVLQLIKPR